jgi:hypothetical protein
MLRRNHGIELDPHDQADFERVVVMVQDALGRERAAELMSGGDRSFDDAVALARELAG